MPVAKDLSKKVLVISHDVAGNTMAGPGIRSVSLARELSRHFDVTLGLLNGSKTQVQELETAYGLKGAFFNENNYEELIDNGDYIFSQWLSQDMLRFARSQGKRIIFDLYAPVPVEFMLYRHFSGNGLGQLEHEELSNLLDTYSIYLSNGDYFVCSNPRQQDLWLGFMLAHGILLDRPESLTDVNSLIGQAPMGISSGAPEHTKKVLRDIVPGIQKDDFILLWTGGLWDWFDPLNVTKAIEQAHEKDTRIKLVFLGTRHPNKKVPHMSAAKNTLDYIQHQKIEGKSVFFIDEWLPFEERINYLLEADAAIYAHKESLETRYSHRSRVLDHIYAGLPTIATGGDYLSDELIADKELGLVADNTVESLANAILQLHSNVKMQEYIRNNINNYKPSLIWEETSKQIVSYIENNDPVSRLIMTEKTPDRKIEKSMNKLLFLYRRIIRKLKRYIE